ncbi:uncharacterized protein UBRO_07063 [Ustilago bromivora]|uniref:RING-type domain-containing protein n=1 Tax=Ustilago bromivora TaxID=307758 RepID=A0A1K0HKU6_9BASI|nr:uncharacterized protein UBRO_07063 [Ustilago bromivora]SYW76739.1 uncharacterized protein UBRO2_01576 [Ustilago bromivora]
MEDAAFTTLNRGSRRKAPSSDNTTLQVVLETPAASPTKSQGRTKRERRASSSRNSVMPDPATDEPARKMPPGKDQQTASHSSKAGPPAKPVSPSASSTHDDGAEKQSHPVSNSVVVDLSSPSPRRNSSKRKADTAQASPARKRPADLARQLFGDDEDQDVKPAAAAAAATIAETTPADASTSTTKVDSVLTTRRRTRRAGTQDSQIESQPSSASFTTAFESEQTPQAQVNAAASTSSNATDAASLQLRIRQLELQLAQTKAKAKEHTELITAQHTIFKDLRNQCTCHICIEPAFRPCVLAPCGHVFCINCLCSWFTKPLASEPDPTAGWSEEAIVRYQRARTLKRKKICPSCRTELACPPVEVYLVRDMLEKVDAGLKLSKEANNVDADLAESSAATLDVDDKARSKAQDLPKGAKVWEDIFDQDGPRRIIFDQVDGVARCGSCASEIFDGTCSNPSCAIEYDSQSDYEDLRRGGWDDVGEFDSDLDSLGGEYGPDPEAIRRQLRGNAPLAERLRRFQDRHGPSEDVRRGGARHRLEVPDDFSGITYIDSDDDEHIAQDYTERDRELRRSAGGGRAEVVQTEDEEEEEDEEDEEMDDFIVRDDEEDEIRGASDSGSDVNGVSDEDSEEGDHFLPGPRRGGQAAAIEILSSSDDEGEDEMGGRRGSSIEHRGRRGGRRVVDDDDDDDDEDDGGDSDSEGEDEVMHSESSSDVDVEDEEDTDTERNLGGSTDSSVRRRRTRIIDHDDDDGDE